MADARGQQIGKCRSARNGRAGGVGLGCRLQSGQGGVGGGVGADAAKLSRASDVWRGVAHGGGGRIGRGEADGSRERCHVPFLENDNPDADDQGAGEGDL